ncbi:MBL fold metallo-hydrolase [Hyphococcus formosus]|uniref:MBL fold metallo-hydrolase n=1 Tax=Hyphococcus formosus TaxID=3143534 RepID=UPI00398B7C28
MKAHTKMTATLLLATPLLAGLSAIAWATAAMAETQSPKPQFNTGNDIGYDVNDPSYFANYAPELPAMLARMPEISADTGLHLSEIEPGLFFVTDGVYQSSFLVTDEGIVVFDAPPSYAHKLPDLIRKTAPDSQIRYLIYSHNHSDHIGGAGVFAKIEGLDIIANERTAESLGKSDRTDLPLPTITFSGDHQFEFGGVPIEIATASFHAEDVDTIIYLPDQKFVMAVDTITPGEVPFMNFGATSDVGAYMTFFDTILEYDFEHLLSGHVSVLGMREDVIINRDYAFDVRQTAGKMMTTFFDEFETAFANFEYKNANLGYRAAIESVRRQCAEEIIDRWQDKLSVVDVWADSHCETVILYNIMH